MDMLGISVYMPVMYNCSCVRSDEKQCSCESMHECNEQGPSKNIECREENSGNSSRTDIPTTTSVAVKCTTKIWERSHTLETLQEVGTNMQKKTEVR